MAELRMVVEEGPRRAFASALDWPGWSRSGRTGEQAVDAVLEYAPRYAEVVRHAGLDWPGSAPSDWHSVIVERWPGTASTEFGVPDAIADVDREPPGAVEAARLADLVAGAWAVLDATAAASPTELRKGPRGGGRDRDPMLEHVVGAESSYARRIGLTIPAPAIDDTAAIEALRTAILEVIRAGEPIPNPRRKLWPVRYAARRIAWHVLDHAWEMADRA